MEELETTLQKLEETRESFWNIERSCAEFLYSLIKIRDAKNVLEIGTSNGYSGLWILRALRYTKGNFTTIEYWEKRQSLARKNFEKFFPGIKTRPLIGDAPVVLEDLYFDIQKGKIQKFDFVFMDANKAEYVEYLELLDKITTKNCAILADNISSHEKKVEPYIKALSQGEVWDTMMISRGAGMMLSIKR